MEAAGTNAAKVLDMIFWLRYLALLPLAVDTLVVSASFNGAAERRKRAQFAFVVAEAGMPLVGLAAGKVVMQWLPWFSFIGGGIVLVLGLREWFEPYLPKQHKKRDATLWLLALSLSVDELGLGFGLGGSRLSVPLAALWIAIQTLIASTVGFTWGRRLVGMRKEYAERIGASALILVGILLLAHRL